MSNIKYIPLVSICIPVYNRENEIDELFRSAHQFDNLDFEFVISDDGSTDNIKTVIGKWATQFFISYVHSAVNRGRAHALHAAFTAARGTYVLPMDSDDLFLPESATLLKYAIDKIRESGEGTGRLIGAIFECVDQFGSVIGTPLPRTVSAASISMLRADYQVTGDKKELIQRTCLLASLVRPFESERRLPTSTYWQALSRMGSVLIVGNGLVLKHYLDNGMTSSLSRIKWRSVRGLALSYRLALANYRVCYNSRRYLLRYATLLAVCYFRMTRIERREFQAEFRRVSKDWRC